MKKCKKVINICFVFSTLKLMVQRLMLTSEATSTYFVLLSWGQTALYLVWLYGQWNFLSDVHYQHPIPVIKPFMLLSQITKHGITFAMLKKRNLGKDISKTSMLVKSALPTPTISIDKGRSDALTKAFMVS
jgi:hypothetical protein